MGKIVAIGGGRYWDGEIVNIAEYIRSLCEKKNPSVVYLPTASFDNVGGDDVLIKLFEDMGCSVKVLYLTDEKLTQDEIKDTILSADIIYAGGGNLYFLMDTFEKTRAGEYLLEAYENGTVLSGYSSGAMCWFDSGYDDCGENGSFVFRKCLGILPFCNCPHFESDSWQSFKQAIKTRDENGVAIEDGAALIYIDGEFSHIRGNDGGDVWLFEKKDGHKPVNITENMNYLKNF